MSDRPTPRGVYTRDLYSLPRRPYYQYNRKVYRKIIDLDEINEHGNPFNTSDFKYHPNYLLELTSGGGYIKRGLPISSAAVFESSTVLPYSLQLLDKQVQPELDFLAPLLSRKIPRIPIIYRISDTWIIDDLGRLYRRSDRGFTWFQYRLSGDLRNNVTLTNEDGTRLTRPVYLFSAIAGYHTDIQYHLAFSFKYEFHHVGENKLDLRPDSVVPLESDLHKYVHNKDLKDEVAKFFKMSKPW